MFNGVEYIRNVCKERGISISSLEKKCGFANGYLNPKKLNKLPYDRALLIADILNISVEYLMTGEKKDATPEYYLNEETAAVAQEIFENKELRALFSVQRDMEPDDLRALHNMALALKRKERGNIDDTGC